MLLHFFACFCSVCMPLAGTFTGPTLANGILEVRKQTTFERGIKSKVLVACAIESETKRVDTMLKNSSFKRMKYLSHKKSSPKQRIDAMHANETLNAKTRCKMLYQASLDKMVVYENKNVELSDLMLNQNSQG